MKESVKESHNCKALSVRERKKKVKEEKLKKCNHGYKRSKCFHAGSFEGGSEIREMNLSIRSRKEELELNRLMEANLEGKWMENARTKGGTEAHRDSRRRK